MTGKTIRLLSVLVFCSLFSATSSAEPVKIKIGWNISPVNMAAIAWHDPAAIGLKNHGKSYIAEPIHFQGSGPQLTALASGRLDVAMVTPLVTVQAKQNAALEAKIIANVLNDPCDGRTFTQPFYVKKDSGIDKVADLKGKTIAVTTLGSGNDLSVNIALRKAGISVKEVTKIEVAAGAIPGFLREGKVDAGPLLPQFVPQLDADGRFKPLFTQCDSLGPVEMVVHMTTADFISKNRAALTDMMADLMHATRWFADPKNREEALRIASEASKQPKPIFESWLFTQKDYGRSPDLRPDLKGLQASVDQSAEFGLIKKSEQMFPEFVDLSVIETAKKQLDGK